MKILAKLLSGFIAVAVLCGIVGVVGIIQISNLNKSIMGLSADTIPTLDYLATVDLEFTNVKVAIRTLANPLLIDDEVTYQRQLANIEKARVAYKAAIASYEAISKVPEEEKLYAELNTLLGPAVEYNNSIMSLIPKIKAAGPEERNILFLQVADLVASDKRLAMDNAQASLRKLLAYDKKYYGKDLPQKALDSAAAGKNILIVVTILAFIVALILGLFLGTSIAGALKNSVKILDKVAAGDISEKMEVKSKDEFKQVAASLNLVITTIGSLVGEAEMLTKAAVDGRLSTRGDAAKFKGGYQSIVEGVNKTLDAVIGPLNVAANYVDRISKGDLPPKISDTYSGDFNEIKNNLNLAIDNINALVVDASVLVQAANDGKLATRADASKHQGDYRKIVDGVNKTLDLVVTPTNETIAVLTRLAEGDLTLRMKGDYKGDFDILKTAMNDSLDSINNTLSEISTAVEQVAEGSVQVSQASQALSQGATEQASSLEEITSSTTEISSQTRTNTDNALKVNTLAKGAQDNAEKGNIQMKDLVSAMKDINTSAEEIKKVVKAIDDIAFQINLLALNANVEAARAGKYGKGFAVVAEEVRNLAVRSANSVKDTTRMVDEAISNIQRGNILVDGTAKQLNEIVGGASQVVILAEEVATAGREQTQGLEQISLGLNQIDQVTQSNTASAEESASASEELSSQAQQVKSMLARFKLKASETKMNNADMMAMLRAELANRDNAHKHSAPPALTSGKNIGHSSVPASHLKNAGVNPADIISLDDNNFGKF